MGIALKASVESTAWSPIFTRIDALKGSEATLRRTVIDRLGIVLTGSAQNETAVLAFRDRLLQVSEFAEVSLPLANLKTNADGTVNFTITIKTVAQKELLDKQSTAQ